MPAVNQTLDQGPLTFKQAVIATTAAALKMREGMAEDQIRHQYGRQLVKVLRDNDVSEETITEICSAMFGED